MRELTKKEKSIFRYILKYMAYNINVIKRNNVIKMFFRDDEDPGFIYVIDEPDLFDFMEYGKQYSVNDLLSIGLPERGDIPNEYSSFDFNWDDQPVSNKEEKK